MTALGEFGIQLLLRTSATSMATWNEECERLWLVLAELGAVAFPANVYVGVALPGFHPDCEIIYFNGALSQQGS